MANNLQAQQQTGQNQATGARNNTISGIFQSWWVRTIIGATFVGLTFTIHSFLAGNFAAGLIAGVVLWFMGGRLEKIKRKADPNAKSIIWIWSGVIRTVGIVVFLSVWLLSGSAKLTSNQVKHHDLAARCEAGELERCTDLEDFRAEQRKAREALAKALDVPSSISRTAVRPAATVAPPPAPPERKATVSQPCPKIPDGAIACYELVLWNWGKPWSFLIQEDYDCPVTEPRGLAVREFVGESTLVNVDLVPSLRTQQASARHEFVSYDVTFLVVPLGAKYKNFTCTAQTP